MRFVRTVFLAAGIFGVIVIAPLFFLEGYLSRQYPPAITHPELYYGFAGTVFAWQLVYLLISRDPVRFRPVMPLAMLAKVSFGVAVCVLLALGRVAGTTAVGATIDLVLAALFLYAYIATGPANRRSTDNS
jgi:hypothetical protein